MEPDTQQQEPDERPLFSAKGRLISAIAAGALLLLGVVLAAFDATGDVGYWAMWISLALGLFHGSKAALESLLVERSFDIDVLMVIGAVVAGAIGQPGEGALLLFLFVLAGALEDLALARTTRAVEALHKLIPVAALRRDDTGAFAEVPPEDLVPADVIKILPGELIPTDATLIEGETSVEQSALTGESVPRPVREGDDLFAGTVNVGNPIVARVTRPATESSLAKIINLVTQAQAQRQPVQRTIDRLSQPYAIGVMAASAAVLLVWWLILGYPFIAPEDGRPEQGALFTAITLLIVLSPCAVIISTPTATLAAISRGARAGVLFKGGQAIERLASLRALAMDKTGTLTIGRPRLQSLVPVQDADERSLLAVAAGLELDSTHPIATAIVEAAQAQSVQPAAATRSSFRPGAGVSGHVDGAEARLGTFDHTAPLIDPALHDRVRTLLDEAQRDGRIGVVIAWANDSAHAGVITLADEIRPGADQLVTEMHAIGVEPVVMLTGDNQQTAAGVAGRVGIDEFHAEMLPEDKVTHMERIRDRINGGTGGVGLVGDGINDSPALAAADVSLAIGSIGSDAALESADIVLLAEDLRTIPWGVRLARSARRTITINLTFALSAIGLMALATLVGSLIGRPLPLWMGVLGHEGGTMLVVGHSLLLLTRAGPKLTAGRPSETAPSPSTPTSRTAEQQVEADVSV